MFFLLLFYLLVFIFVFRQRLAGSKGRDSFNVFKQRPNWHPEYSSLLPWPASPFYTSISFHPLNLPIWQVKKVFIVIFYVSLISDVKFWLLASLIL